MPRHIQSYRWPWVVGHAHLVMFGVFSMWQFGVMTYLFPRILKRHWYSKTLCEWHFWLSAGAVVVMFLDLTFAGLLQGFWWSSLQPWEASTNGSQPFWITRTFAGLAMAAGLVVFLFNLYMTWRKPVETDFELTSAAAGS